ncbi:hypothetical protein BSK66_25505 [Paenibacillus odorifer]|uniref:hypothetical protein n=1 Tax=Paenibacillus TaxID=44249 RepID=UPI0003E246F6|nr:MULTISPECIES: hypothetical protein [Paenibacillus]ETT46271.1 hypothetical protein C171_28487 [Paenibacillus sp. FSL H8-237]OME50199.1 hypothetical protein BSK66_25505 [Paenibacillus odorifer]
MAKKQVILDLDQIIIDERVVILAGKRIDVSRIPSRVTLDIAKNSDELQSGSQDTFPLLLDQVASILRPSFPEVNADWIVDNTDLNQLLKLIEFVLEPVKERAGNETEKNEVSPSQ